MSNRKKIKSEPKRISIQKSIIGKRYEKMLAEHTGVDLEPVNCYTCKCGNKIKTIRLDLGVTPMFILCPKCAENMASSFHRDIYPEIEPTIEWYRPSQHQLYTSTPQGVEHALLGGLFMRSVTNRDKIKDILEGLKESQLNGSIDGLPKL